MQVAAATDKQGLSMRAHAAAVRAEAAVAVEAVVSVRAVSTAMAEIKPDGVGAEWRRKLSAEALYRIPKTETAYGPIMTETTIMGKLGPLTIQHVNPFAL